MLDVALQRHIQKFDTFPKLGAHTKPVIMKGSGWRLRKWQREVQELAAENRKTPGNLVVHKKTIEANVPSAGDGTR